MLSCSKSDPDPLLLHNDKQQWRCRTVQGTTSQCCRALQGQTQGCLFLTTSNMHGHVVRNRIGIDTHTYFCHIVHKNIWYKKD